jgi:predicted nucleic acid-binding protein
MNGVVIDTDVFVAAKFNARSISARILAAVREGDFQLVWNKPTRGAAGTILRRIPGLDWARVADLFEPEDEFTGPVDPNASVMVADRDDRKFAALSAAAKTPLVTNDNHVLVEQRVVDILCWTIGRPLGGEAFGDEWLVRRRCSDIRCRRGSLFLDLGEQPGLDRGGRPRSLRIVMGETAGLENYGAQLGDAAATSVVEMHKRKARPRHRILQECDRRCHRQTMLAA